MPAYSSATAALSRFMAGSDLSSRDVGGIRRPFHIPSIGLHDELALFVNSGFTPAEALQTATSNVAQYAGASWEFGTLETGKRADIVLLDANPLEDIRNTRKIHGVILGGRLFSRSELDDMVDRAVQGR
jgi:adenine deaminase